MNNSRMESMLLRMPWTASWRTGPMVMASLAWTLKAWFALLVHKREHRDQLLGMEFRRFLHGLIRIPVQIICAGHRIRYRILGYNQWVYTFMETFDLVQHLRWCDCTKNSEKTAPVHSSSVPRNGAEWLKLDEGRGNLVIFALRVPCKDENVVHRLLRVTVAMTLATQRL